MKKSLYILSALLLNVATLLSQESDSLSAKKWNLGADLNLYMIPGDIFLLPVIRADKNTLHLEARYNYEDFQTVSLWGGYNFKGGKKLKYILTPMAGVVVGNTNGFALGFEMTLNFKRFELYSESEYLMDVSDKENNYTYNWSNLSYYPLDWLWVGITGQRTKLFHSSFEIQKGLLLGAALKNWELNSYFFNLGHDDFYWIVSLSYSY